MGVEIHKGLISPALDITTVASRNKFGSEQQHVAVREGLHHLVDANSPALKLLESMSYKDPKLNTNVGGIELSGSPVMVGAGWDKAGRAVGALTALGFSGVEVGSVLEFPQPGNDKPRQFMIGRGVALNRLGFNSPGMHSVEENLEEYRGKGLTIGVSLGKNKDVPENLAPMAHHMVAAKLYDLASYFAINVSSPNTPGLRALQDKGPLTDIVQAVNAAMDSNGKRIPVFVKVAPDLTNEALMDVIGVVSDNGLAGIIATNTTVRGDIKAKYGREPQEMGGVSGDDEDFRTMSREKTQFIYNETNGEMGNIGIGGIKDALTAWQRLADGANALQLVTALRGEGLMVASKINRGLIQLMDSYGVHDLNEIRGKYATDPQLRLY